MLCVEMHRTRRISANSRRTQLHSETGCVAREESVTGMDDSIQFEDYLVEKKDNVSLLDKTGLKDKRTGVVTPTICDLNNGKVRSVLGMAAVNTSSSSSAISNKIHADEHVKECEENGALHVTDCCNASQTSYEQWLLEQKNHGYSEEIVAASVLTSLSSVFATTFTTNNKTENGTGLFTGNDVFTYSNDDLYDNDIQDKPYQEKKNLRTIFKCTWPKCGQIFRDSNTIISHVRSSHLGPKDENDNGFSDGEEEFYFNEIDVDSLRTTQRSSSPQIRRYRSLSDPSPITQTPVIPNDLCSHSDDNVTRPLRSAVSSHKLIKSKRSNQVVYQRKTKGDGRKCRKVYGMDNKQLWCTQCRWKKACIKFID